MRSAFGMPELTTNAWLRFDAIRSALRTADPATVLEMGAGEGALGAWLARRYDYTAVELDDRSRSTAAGRLAVVGRGTVVAAIDDLGDRRFDLVCAFEVLEHIADDEGALAEWRDHVRAGGWLLLSVPAHEARFGASDELVGHYRRYERPVLTARLASAGWEIESFRSYGAGLGNVLDRVRNLLARRVARTGTPEERTSGSGRLFQPRSTISMLSCAAVAAPFRVLQVPFSRGEHGTGYVVLARRS